MENKPVCEIGAYGTKFWYLNRLQHREDGPAVEYTSGLKIWYKHGERHRLDGPAVEYPDNLGKSNWYINDANVTNKIIKWAENNDIDLDNLTEVDKALIKLTWADYGKYT